MQQYHANDYNAATGEYIPAENKAMAMAMAMAKNKNVFWHWAKLVSSIGEDEACQ